MSDPAALAPTVAPFEGARALVTGGGSGIGLACARVLAEGGAAVTLMGRRLDTIEAAAADLRAATGAEVTAVAGSVTDADDGAAPVAAAAAGGALTHVVVNAGTGGMEVLYMTIQPVESPVTMHVDKAVLYVSDSLGGVTSYDLSPEVVAEIDAMDSSKIIEVQFSHADPKDAVLEIEYVDDGYTFSITESNPLWVWEAST